MKPIPFYDEYLARVITPKILQLLRAEDFTSVGAMRSKFNDSYEVAVPLDMFRQWFKDSGFTVTKLIRVVREGIEENLQENPGPVETPEVKYTPLPQGYAPLPSITPTARGGIMFEGD